MKVSKEVKFIILKRILITLGILFLIRVGTFLPVPGINHSELSFYIQHHSGTKSLVSTFSGNNTFVIGLFTLNIFPYINASILVQLILGFDPKLSKLQKEGELKGRRSINKLTRVISLVFALVQSFGLALYLKQILFNWNYLLASEIILWLTTGAMIVLWLGELITDYGLGNGTSLLIYTNIVSSLPNLARIIFNDDKVNIISSLIICLVLAVSLYGIIFLQEGLRIIPLISSKQLNKSSFSYQSSGNNNYLPLRFNQAGVMPIILTTTILIIPNYLSNLGILPVSNLQSFGILYWIVYFGLILGFSSFYANIVLNPKDISDQLQKMAVSIPGIRPGIQTTFYLKQVMKRTTLIGAILLAIIVIFPNFLESLLDFNGLNGLSTSSLLILAGVILDLVREIKNIYYANVYNNLY